MSARAALLIALWVGLPAHADGQRTQVDDHGILNPDDAGLDMLIRKVDMGITDSVTCSLAFNGTKYDQHAVARRIALRCAEGGFVTALTWLSLLDSNGMGGAPDPVAAAKWDRRAAEAGDPVGLYNHGLNLLRGSGVPRDLHEGRRFVDLAAAAGFDSAARLRESGYDLESVTPDAEESAPDPTR